MIDLSEYDLVYDYRDNASGEDYPADHQLCSWSCGLLLWYYESYDVSLTLQTFYGQTYNVSC